MNSISACPHHTADQATAPASGTSTASSTGTALEAPECPTADWVEVTALPVDPYPTYARLREEAPVAWVPALKRVLVTDYESSHAVEQNPEQFTANVSGATMNRALGGQPMLRKDDPEHAADRTPVNPVLRPKVVKEQWAPLFRRNAETYLDRLAEAGPGHADLNRDYAGPVAAQNLMDVLGFKEVPIDQFARWSHDFIAGTGNVLDDPEIWVRCERSAAEADERIVELIPYYRGHPNSSMISAWANSDLPIDNIVANIKLTISGGFNEPQHMVTNMVWALSSHPEQAARVLDDPRLWPAVFDETVRWRSPIGMFPREASEDVILGGVRIPAGTNMGVVVASANRDPAHFGETADDFDIARAKKPHLAFGSGPHLCAGHWVAKMSIGQIAVPLAYERFPGLRTDDRRPENWDGWVFRGLTSLPVTWD